MSAGSVRRCMKQIIGGRSRCGSARRSPAPNCSTTAVITPCKLTRRQTNRRDSPFTRCRGDGIIGERRNARSSHRNFPSGKNNLEPRSGTETANRRCQRFRCRCFSHPNLSPAFTPSRSRNSMAAGFILFPCRRYQLRNAGRNSGESKCSIASLARDESPPSVRRNHCQASRSAQIESSSGGQP